MKYRQDIKGHTLKAQSHARKSWLPFRPNGKDQMSELVKEASLGVVWGRCSFPHQPLNMHFKQTTTVCQHPAIREKEKL